MQMLDIPRLVQTCPPGSSITFGGTVDRFYFLLSLGLEAHDDYVSKYYFFLLRKTHPRKRHNILLKASDYNIVRYGTKTGVLRVAYEKLKCPVILGIITP